MERRMDRRERERSRQASSHGDRVDLDSRTPLAWQHRDFNYHGQASAFHERYPEGVASSGSDRFSHPSIGSRSARSAAAAMAAQQRQRKHSESEQLSHKIATSSRSSSGGGGGGGVVGVGKKLSTSSQETGEAASDRNRNSVHHSEETTGSETETDAERGQPSRPGTSGTIGSIQSMPLLSPLHAAAYNPSLGGIYGVVGMAPAPPMPHNPTWNGEPCPVHGAGLHSHGQMALYATPNVAYSSVYGSLPIGRAPSMHELAMATPLPAIMPPPGPIYGTLAAPPPPPPGPFLVHAPPPPPQPEPTFVMMAGPPSVIGPPPASSLGGRRMRRPGPGSLPPMPPPSLLPPMQSRAGPRPLVVNGKSGHAEPLPVRDAPPLPPKIPPSDVVSRTNSRSSSTKPFSYNACCKGNVVVLWVILGIIGLGIVMAVVFYFAFQ